MIFATDSGDSKFRNDRTDMDDPKDEESETEHLPDTNRLFFVDSDPTGTNADELTHPFTKAGPVTDIRKDVKFDRTEALEPIFTLAAPEMVAATRAS